MKIRFSLIICSLLFCLYDSKLRTTFRAINNNQCLSTLSITGRSSINIPTNLIQININIITKELTANKALSENTNSSIELNKSFQNMAIPRMNISTTEFSITSKYNNTYDYKTKTYTNIFDGFKVQNSIQVLLSDLIIAGNVIDSVSKIYGGQVSSINLISSDIDQLNARNGLISLAAIDAQNQANISLKQDNYQILGIQSIQINNINTNPPRREIMAFENASMVLTESAPTLYSSKQSIKMEISVVFCIGAK